MFRDVKDPWLMSTPIGRVHVFLPQTNQSTGFESTNAMDDMK